MASITIRQLGKETKRRLRIRAATHGRSMEEEAREILKGALSKGSALPTTDLAESIRTRLAPLGGLELAPTAREPIAGIVASREATLATRNVADFEGFGLRLINPWS